MTSGNQSFLNPRQLLEAVVNDFGEKFKLGDEHDIREFNDIFLGRINDALKTKNGKVKS